MTHDVLYQGEANAKLLALIAEWNHLRDAAIAMAVENWKTYKPYEQEVRLAERMGKDPRVVEGYLLQRVIHEVAAPYNREIGALHAMLAPTIIITKDRP